MHVQRTERGIIRTLIGHNWLVIYAIILVAVPQLWFKDGYFFAGGDIAPPLFSARSLHALQSTWSPYNFGAPGFSIVQLPYALFFVILQTIGIPPWLCQRILYTLLFAGAALSMYYLTSSVFTNDSGGAAVASFFYAFNIMEVQSVLNPVVQASYLLTPLLMALLFNGARAFSNKHLLYIMVASLLLPLVFFNPATFLVLIGTLATFSLFLVLFSHDERWHVLRYLSTAIFLAILVNAWWILPTAYMLFSGTGSNPSFTVTVKTPLQDSLWTMSRNLLANVLSLNDIWSWTQQEYFSFDLKLYESPVMIFLSFMPAFLAGGGLLLHRRKDRSVVTFFGIFGVVALFLEKGVNSPAGLIYWILYDHAPLFWLFRSPKFLTPIIVAYSALLTALCSALSDFRTSVRRALFFAIVLLIVSSSVAQAFPMFNGQIVPPSYPTRDRALISIPDYWFDAGNWIRNQTGIFRVLILPIDPNYSVRYNWGYYGTDSLPLSLISFESIVVTPPPTPYGGGYGTAAAGITIGSYFYSAIMAGNSSLLANLLTRFNVRFVVERTDVDSTLTEIMSPQDVSNFLSAIPGLSHVRTFGQIQVYEYRDYGPRLKFIGPGQVTHISRGSAAEYTIDYSAKGRTTLVFFESYDPNWRLYYENATPSGYFGENPISPFLYDRYAMAWNFTTYGRGKITLVYVPQQLFELSALLSTSTLLVVAVLLMRSSLSTVRIVKKTRAGSSSAAS